MRLVLVLGLVPALAACGPAVGDVPRPAVERPAPASADRLLLGRAPFQQWPTLSARAVGLVVQYDSPHGRLVSWTRGLRRLEDQRFPTHNPRYYFVTESASPWAMYFASKGEGHNVLRHWQVPLPGGHGASFPLVAMYEPGTPNPYGLRAPAHLVEVEVNGGQGAAPGLHFVATGCRVLDGSRAYPIVVADALAAARRRYDELLASQQPAVASALERAARTPGAEPYGPTTTMTHEGIMPTWLHAPRRLRVVFYRAVTASSFKTEPAAAAALGGAARGPGPWRPPRGPVTRTRTHGAELGLEVEFDHRGRLVAERVFAAAPLGREALEALGMAPER